MKTEDGTHPSAAEQFYSIVRLVVLVIFSLLMKMALSQYGIRVNAVGSGDAVTNITNHIHEDGPAFLAEHGKNAPIKRAANPREIAEVIAFLASEKAT